MRFTSGDLELPLKYLQENKILFFTYNSIHNVALHTHRNMFSYFSEDPCLYKGFGEVEAGNIAFRKGHVTDTVLRQWASCALDASCLAPMKATKNCGRAAITIMRDDLIGRCHRFDQSALSIILRRLYHRQMDYPLVETPFDVTVVQRRHEIPYFM